MLTFFYSTGTCSTAVHIAFAEAGIEFKGVEVSWQRKVNLDELAAVNPLGQVPALVDEEGRVLTQTIAILEFIANRAKEKKLMPESGTWQRSQAMGWLAFIGADLQKSFAPMFYAPHWTKDEATQTAIKQSVVDSIDKHLAYIDQKLAGSEYLLGNQFSVADAHLFTVVGWCKWSGNKISKYKNLVGYMKRVNDRPQVQKILQLEGLTEYVPE
jgi:glutathione S-transferase